MNSLADRFCLRLTRSWRRWFAVDSQQLKLPGCFRFPVNALALCMERPAPIWAGFMQPDTLPLVGNGYGDWICVRVTAKNTLGELIHWYHGGGDWIPIGHSMPEAILHDTVDQFRPQHKQMLRGAAESLLREPHQAAPSMGGIDPSSIQWLQKNLAKTHSGVNVESILSLAIEGNYARAIESLIKLEASIEASTCDFLEWLIHESLPNDQALLTDLPGYVCKKIDGLCTHINRRRSDLGWSHALSGQCRQILSKPISARKAYFKGRLASAFSDQSVRLRLHRFSRRFGKFSIAQLVDAQPKLTGAVSSDEYLRVVLGSSADTLQANVQHFWEHRAKVAMKKKKYAQAYEYWMMAGWDLGAARLSDYRILLEEMANAADQAGWAARANVARTHLQCL